MRQKMQKHEAAVARAAEEKRAVEVRGVQTAGMALHQAAEIRLQGWHGQQGVLVREVPRLHMPATSHF